LDPVSNVALRANAGGPAPEETARMIEERMRLIAEEEKNLAGMRSRVDGAIEVLRDIGRSDVLRDLKGD
jgi:hypothetical protein